MKYCILLVILMCSTAVAYADQFNENDVKRLASDLNKRKFPVQISNDMRLDSASAGPGVLLTYNNTLLNYRANQVNKTEYFDAAKLAAQKIQVCSSPDLAKLFKRNVTIRYSYNGNDGRNIGQITYTPKECGY